MATPRRICLAGFIVGLFLLLTLPVARAADSGGLDLNLQIEFAGLRLSVSGCLQSSGPCSLGVDLGLERSGESLMRICIARDDSAAGVDSGLSLIDSL